MANNNQDSEWDSTSSYLSQVASVACEDLYLAGPLDSAFCVQDAFIQHAANFASQSATPFLLPGVMQEYPIIEGWSQEQHSSEEPKTFLKERSPANRTGKVLSPEAIQRRRKQNRASQVAFRTRTKKMIEDLQQQLTLCTEQNHTMYLTMHNLLERTDSLKRAIEGALASQRSILFESQTAREGRFLVQ